MEKGFDERVPPTEPVPSTEHAGSEVSKRHTVRYDSPNAPHDLFEDKEIDEFFVKPEPEESAEVESGVVEKKSPQKIEVTVPKQSGEPKDYSKAPYAPSVDTAAELEDDEEKAA